LTPALLKSNLSSDILRLCHDAVYSISAMLFGFLSRWMFRGTLSYKALCGFYKSLQLADMMQTIENLVECAIVSDETM
jgi:hypothetical protein